MRTFLVATLSLFLYCSFGFASEQDLLWDLINESNYAQLNSSQRILKKQAAMEQIIALRKPLQKEKKIKNVFFQDSSFDTYFRSFYNLNLVEVRGLTRHLSDKLLVWKLLKKFLGEEEASFFHPKTVGLKDFLIRNRLLKSDKTIISDRSKIKAAFTKEFPMGFIVKPAAGRSSAGKGKLFYFKSSDFLRDLLKEDSPLYSAENFFKPFLVADYKLGPLSGEKMILQENVVTAAGSKKVLRSSKFKEVRVHTYQRDVIPNSTSSRWDKGIEVSDQQLDQASEFVQDLLDQLPDGMLARQAWSIDLAVFDNGVIRMIELNTNRGTKANHWSGFLRRPRELTAYSRFLEKEYGYHITGLTGFLFRNYMGNYSQWWRRMIKRSPDGIQKVITRYLPPWPFPLGSYAVKEL